MANKSRAKKNSTKGVKKSRNRARSLIGLDGAAVDHVRLLADPCNAKLCYPAYPGTGNGALIRRRLTFQVGAGAGETCGLVTVVPGLNAFKSAGSSATSTVLNPAWAAIYPFVTNDSYRAVAACLEAFPNASELNRSGLVAVGCTNHNWFDVASTVDGISGRLPYLTRAPDARISIKWVPSLVDTEFADPNTTPDRDGNNRLSFAFSGASAGTGYTIVVTVVYENVQTNNFVNTVQAPASRSSLNDVVRGVFNFAGGLVEVGTTVFNGLNHLASLTSVAGQTVPMQRMSPLLLGA